MPTYDYHCKNCDHEFELFQSMSDGVKKKCPECGKMTLERLIGTGAAVIFKGSGFYETDYRSKSYTSDQEADSKAAKKATESKSDTKSDKKPEKKAKSKPAQFPSKTQKD
ncbi:MAG: FmdB family zinc ribbon protein [Phycisphaerales bacterium]